jgi:hypothetical protein
MKAHPAERLWGIAGESYQLHNVLRYEHIKLPDNIIFLDYDTDFASFDLYGLVNGLIAYSSSTCMEFGWTGKQSISIYDSHYTCADFTTIPNSAKDFFEILQNVLSNDVNETTSSEIIERARAYYFLYNHITQIDMKLFVGNDLETVPTKALYSSVDDLAEGKNEALDYICNAIIQEKPIFGENIWPPVTI